MSNPDPKPDTDWPEVRLASAEEKLKSGRFLYIVEREVETVNFGISPFKSITSETSPFEPSDAIAAIRELKAENARLRAGLGNAMILHTMSCVCPTEVRPAGVDCICQAKEHNAAINDVLAGPGATTEENGT